MGLNAFSFRDISFGYGTKEILRIKNLDLPAQSLIFVVGSSGIGKSTLLESIGLMSNAFLNTNSNSVFQLNDDRINPEILWKADSSQLYELRNRYFSFIFQSTNLMSEFTVLENILMAAKYRSQEMNLIQDKIHQLLDAMTLHPDILNRLPHEISGGQKQRVAFIRALSSEFEILLADEPTGNLDMNNSHALFKILREQIIREKKTAIIVSHHLELAKVYGDLIVQIKKHPEKNYAETRAHSRANFNDIILK